MYEDSRQKKQTKPMRQDSTKTLGSVEGKMISPLWTDDNVFKNPQSY